MAKKRATRATIEQKGEQYRAEHRQIARLTGWGRSTLLLFILLYELLFNLVVAPLGRFLWTQALVHSPAHYIVSSNLFAVLRSPLIWAALLVIVLGYTFWNLLEVSAIVTYMDCIWHQKRMGILPLLRRACLNIGHVFLPKNLPLLIFAAVVLPFTNVFAAGNFISQLVVPEYIMEVIQANPLYLAAFVLATAALMVWAMEWLFVFHYFVLEHRNLADAARHAIHLRKNHRMRSIWLVLWRKLWVCIKWFFVLAVAVALAVAAMLYMGGGSTALVSAQISLRYLLLPAFTYFVGCFATFAQYACLTVLYHEYKEGAGEDASPLPPEARPAKKHPPHRWTLPLVFGGTAAAGVLLTLAVSYTITTNNSLEGLLSHRAQITSHRGYSAKAPENTLPAFQAAIDCGVADYAELDVQQTSDGVVVLSHDANLKRCTGMDTPVTDISYEALRKLDASFGYTGPDPEKFIGTKIPTLDEVIKLCKGKIKLNIEIKGNTPTLEAETVRIIQENGFGDQCVVTSLRYDALEKVKAIDPTLKCGYIMAMGAGNYYDLPAADFFSVETTFVTSGMVQELHARGKEVHVWTVDGLSDAQKMLNRGVDNIITGQPELIYQSMTIEDDLLTELWSGDFSALVEPAPTQEQTAEPGIDTLEELLEGA
ncbi:MAG: glycerophosphodiester phosphodiesterase [Pygmaiobacter sp.]|nr:glycerophosphodiester phosphodiesterase [Pygmaiobacter sp.]